MWEKLREAVRAVFTCHRSDDETVTGGTRNFFLPKPTRGFFVRMAAVAVTATVVFGWLLRPCVINGESMMPTYPGHGFTFCRRFSYWFAAPKVGDVVVIRYTGRVYYLKRVVAGPGDTVEFRRGILYVNGAPRREPYVRYTSDWELEPRKVPPGHVYVVGDNRSMPMLEHRFGRVSVGKIIGTPLW